jgi:uncharacterized LabA/DUF88 family protein
VPAEPTVKRAVAFFDGQNLFHAARRVFGATYPDFDPLSLAQQVCERKGWLPVQCRFYTGVPAVEVDSYWHDFWKRKLGSLRRRGVHVCSRELQYHDEIVTLSDGTSATVRLGREKGIDVRIALDVVRLAISDAYDVALVFSQDQDLAEAALEVRDISMATARWIKIACAYPWSPASRKRGINNTEWIRIDSDMYAESRDPRDYRVSRWPRE